jgi:hypothetical protein
MARRSSTRGGVWWPRSLHQIAIEFRTTPTGPAGAQAGPRRWRKSALPAEPGQFPPVTRARATDANRQGNEDLRTQWACNSPFGIALLSRSLFQAIRWYEPKIAQGQKTIIRRSTRLVERSDDEGRSKGGGVTVSGMPSDDTPPADRPEQRWLNRSLPGHPIADCPKFVRARPAGWSWRLPTRAPTDPYVLILEYTVLQPTDSPSPKGPRSCSPECRGHA